MTFLQSQNGDDYFNPKLFDQKEKEKISPEVYKLEWLPLDIAVENCLTSVLDGIYVNEWQEREFYTLGRSKRDPLVMTGAILVELETFPNVETLQAYCDHVSLQDLCKMEQGLKEAKCTGFKPNSDTDTLRQR